jgi:hypothetical protein
MAYFEKQKFNILELVLRKDSPRKILLVEPEYYLRVLLKNLLEKEITDKSNYLFNIYYDNPGVELEIIKGKVKTFDKLTKEEISEIMKASVPKKLNASEALRVGIIDRISDI